MVQEVITQSAPEWWTWAWWAANSESIRNLVLSVGAGLGLGLLWSRTRSLRRQADTAEQRHYAQVEADRERRITDSFTRSVEQLGSDRLETRLGAIYTLERIARESPLDHWPIMETLTAFVRERAPWTREKAEQAADPDRSYVKPAADVQAVLTVIGRRRHEYDPEGQRLNLRRTDLRGADLTDAHLENASLAAVHLEEAILKRTRLHNAELTLAHLKHADLAEAHLDGASLRSANLENAKLSEAHLREANLRKACLELADLEGARLDHAKLLGAHLENAFMLGTRLEHAELQGVHLDNAELVLAHLEHADVRHAHLEHAILFKGHLQGTRLQGAHLEGAELRDTDITQEQLDQAITDENTKVPPGLRTRASRH